jgi:hypothetical protein
MSLVRARLTNVSADPTPPPIEVLFNPTDYGIAHAANYAAMEVPGLSSPIYQFVRGEADVLSVELFLDRTSERQDVEDALKELRQFVRIDGNLHHPPVCRFDWGQVSFTGIVTSLRDRYVLFAEDGRVVRARVSLTLKTYRSAEVQLRELKRSSPDRTHRRVLREGETLSTIAGDVYGDPRLWRVIAEANGIDQPRLVPPGTPLVIPAL